MWFISKVACFHKLNKEQQTIFKSTKSVKSQAMRGARSAVKGVCFFGLPYLYY